MQILIANTLTVLISYFFESDTKTFFTILFFSTFLQIVLYALEDIRRSIIEKKNVGTMVILNVMFTLFYSSFCLGFIFILNQDRIPNGPGMLDSTWILFKENMLAVCIATLPILFHLILDAVRKVKRIRFVTIHVKIVFSGFILAVGKYEWAIFVVLGIKCLESLVEAAIQIREREGNAAGPGDLAAEDPLMK